jgi:hypothetical protein
VTVLEAPKRFIGSRRFKQLLPWISGLVLLVGVGTFLGTHYSNTAKQESTKATGPAIPPETPQTNIPFPHAAWQVAREFAFTAVSRKNLDEAYAITHPDLRAGISKKTWESGELPVQFIPVRQILKFNWKNTNYAHPRDAQINVILIPTKASHMRAFTAQIGLAKVGKGSSAHWLVNYFQLLSGPMVPTYS